MQLHAPTESDERIYKFQTANCNFCPNNTEDASRFKFSSNWEALDAPICNTMLQMNVPKCPMYGHREYSEPFVLAILPENKTNIELPTCITITLFN